METTHTQAGQLAIAGAARLRAGAPVASYAGCTTITSAAVLAHHASGHKSIWTEGVKPATTFMVLDRMNRPTRPLPERSP